MFIIEVDTKFSVATIVFFICVFLLTQLSLRHVSGVVTTEPKEPLLDLYHTHIPEEAIGYQEYSDWIPVSVIVLFVVLDKLEHATEFMFLLSIIYLLRVISFSLTILPSPTQECKQEWESKPETMLRGILNLFYQEGCGDLVFSGHTSCMVMATLFLYKYCFPGNLMAALGLLMYNIIGAITIIGTRLHYSVDVFIASVISVLLFFSFQK